jgi:CP family cyanate transporter-like MFS transporter
MIRFQMPPERSSVHWKGGMIESLSGRLLLGQLHDWTGGWTAPLLITAAISVAGAFTGMLAGRNVQLEPAESSSRTSPAIQSANALTAGDRKR